jgi:hypothetical protein
MGRLIYNRRLPWEWAQGGFGPIPPPPPDEGAAAPLGPGNNRRGGIVIMGP